MSNKTYKMDSSSTLVLARKLTNIIYCLYEFILSKERNKKLDLEGKHLSMSNDMKTLLDIQDEKN